MQTFISDFSNKTFNTAESVLLAHISPGLYDFVSKKYPHLSRQSLIAAVEFSMLKEAYLTDFLSKEMGDLNSLHKDVIQSLSQNSIINQYPSDDDDSNDKAISFADRLADKVASFGGSWTFIISFILFLLLWIAVNAFILLNKGFDPYPFILLNLILSCVAALQAPVIMMSQNRQESKDRERAKNDYRINLKSELEIRILHEKIDHLLIAQQNKLISLQEDQLKKVEALLASIKKD